MESSNSVPTTLALVGKTGYGKSTTANSILGRNDFKTSDSTTACTFMTMVGYAIRDGIEIKVVDSPGFMDPDKIKSIDNVTKQVPGIMGACPKGIHAMVMVLKYGNRFTQEDIDTALKLKQIFGKDFLKEYGVIIFTHGENFDLENEEKKEKNEATITFETWCKLQKGEIQNLFHECKNRVVLFYNKDVQRYAEKRKNAVDQLLKIADELRKKGAYLNDSFRQCHLQRERLLLEHKLPELNIEFQRKIDLLNQDITQFKQSNFMTEIDLTKLKMRGKDLFDEIDKICLDTNLMDGLKQKVKTIQQSIENIDLKKPLAEQLSGIQKALDILKDPPMSVAVGAIILGCLIIVAGVGVSIASGGVGAVVAAPIIEAVGIILIRAGSTTATVGLIAYLMKLLKPKSKDGN